MEGQFEQRAGLATWVGLSVAGLGLSELLLFTWIAYLNDPAIGLLGGYGRGDEPWTSLGVALVVGGALLAHLSAVARIAVRGDWLRRFLVVPLSLLPAAWWLTALGMVPLPRFVGPDPVQLGYTLPVASAALLLIPAMLVAGLAFLPIRPDRRVRLRPVHPETPAPPRA